DCEKALAIIRQVAAAVDFAHKNNILHGNLRPSNILFDKDDVVKLSDFALPIQYDGPKQKNWYSPPERKSSRQGDVYGIGVILHQMLTGRNPRYDENDNLDLDDIRMFLPEEIAAMLDRLLAIRIARRYRSCAEFLLDWEDFDRRRQEERRQQESRAAAAPAAVPGKPVWLYLAIGAGIAFALFTVLYLAGVFSL
ncbi:MAG TPA: protein kinase, partial [candidate division Zixibacteria bacterium]|nr:protein kinase [candidate division Zixibacteria bacterium]